MSAPTAHNPPGDRVEAAGRAPCADTATNSAASGVGGTIDGASTSGDAGTGRASGASGDEGAGAVAGRRGLRRFPPAVLTKLHAARLWIMIHRPYYCRALFACPLIPDDTRPTMTIAMDHKWRIYINPDYVASCSVEKTAAVLIHEINHALRAHAERGLQTASLELVEYWKAACEFEINDDLVADGLDVGDSLLPHRFGLDPYQSAEAYYQQLIDAAAEVGEVPDCGPVCAAHPGHQQLHCGSDEGLSGLQRWLTRQATAKTILADRGDDVRDVPAGLRAWAKDTLGSSVNWRRVLARALRHSLHTRAGASDYTWQRPPRRQDPDDHVIRPALAAPTGEITVVLDTSGSMGPTEHARAFSEIDAIVKKAVPGQAIRVLSVDDDVHSDQRINQARQITPAGGRGTDMAAGIEAAAENAPAAIVVITDGYTPWPQDPPPGARCVIAALTDNDLIHEVPGWIQAIDISQDLHHDG